MKRIHSLHLRNFKAFQEQIFPFEGNHTLIYGNNGSGKSSLYWSLYTLAESYTKEQIEINKYFKKYDANDDSTYESLRNRYGRRVKSFVQIDWKDESLAIGSPDREGSSIMHEQGIKNTDAALGEINLASDFVNYRLFQHFNGSNRHDVDVWPAFVRDILPYFKISLNTSSKGAFYTDFITALDELIDLRTELRRAEVIAEPYTQYEDYLEESEAGEATEDEEPKPGYLEVQQKKALTDEYNTNVRLYAAALAQLVTDVETASNDYLKSQFNLSEGQTTLSRIILSYENSSIDSVFDRLESQSDRTLRPGILRNGFSDLLRIRLTVKMGKGPNARVERRPQTFLNEAKLTRLAFALRIGALLHRVKSSASSFNVLCFDDVLISLDMGNRLEMLDWLFSATVDIPDATDPSGEAKKSVNLLDYYQVIFLTHERELFYLFQKYIKLYKNPNQPWNIWELHGNGRELREPPVFIEANPTYAQRALGFFQQGEYVACGNALRSHCEQILRDFLSPDKAYNVKDDGEISGQLLGALISGLNSLLNKHGNELRLVDSEIKQLKKLNIYKSLLLNPLSHANDRTSVFAEELQIVLHDVVPVLNSLQSEYKVRVQFPATGTVLIKKTDRGGRKHEMVFELREPWIVQHFPGGITIPTDPAAKIISHKIDGVDEIIRATTQWKNIYGIWSSLVVKNPAYNLEKGNLKDFILLIAP